MDTVVFSAKPYDGSFLDAAADGRHGLRYIEVHLTPATALLAHGAGAVCAFVNERMDDAVLDALHGFGDRLVTL